VVFAMLTGTWFLKEAFTVRRGMAAGAIVAGVLGLRLG
jgi:multidrug transporter EmrE-like cation transporter